MSKSSTGFPTTDGSIHNVIIYFVCAREYNFYWCKRLSTTTRSSQQWLTPNMIRELPFHHSRSCHVMIDCLMILRNFRGTDAKDPRRSWKYRTSAFQNIKQFQNRSNNEEMTAFLPHTQKPLSNVPDCANELAPYVFPWPVETIDLNKHRNASTR